MVVHLSGHHFYCLTTALGHARVGCGYGGASRAADPVLDAPTLSAASPESCLACIRLHQTKPLGTLQRMSEEREGVVSFEGDKGGGRQG